MIQENDFMQLVTNPTGSQPRTTLSNMPWTAGDKAKFTNIETRDVEGNKFAALVTSDGGFVSANAMLRRGNGINYGTDDLSVAAKKLFDAVGAANGLDVEFAKVFKADNNRGGKTTYYRFAAKEL